MTFDKSFTLFQMADDARKIFDATADRVDRIDEILDTQMEGKTMGQMTGSALGSLIWLGLYVGLYFIVKEMTYSNPSAPVALIAALVLMVLMLADHFVKLRYYGSISRTRSQLQQVRGRIEAARNNLSDDLNAFLSFRSSGWNLDLAPGNAIDEDLDEVERSISSMVALQSGGLQKLKVFAYYITSLAWAFSGSMALSPLLQTFLEDTFSYDTISVIAVIGAVIVTVADYFVAKYFWSRTNCAVTNMTLIGTLIGPVLFGLLALAAALVVLLVTIVFEIIKFVAAAAIALALLSGFCSGG